jgi:hypothetical protein
MKYHETEKPDALVPYQKPVADSTGSCIDCSEEAIPERDPAYRPLDGTLYEGQTVETMPSDVRQALARCLEELGMSASRAAMIATL